MVVCKCRKATKFYCFVHKVPVCGECICFSEHQICVVRTYSEWVIDGEYDWPPFCCNCQSVLEGSTHFQTTRLGCLHVVHTNCLVSHIKSFPPHTAPEGYVCRGCSTPIWPPKSIKDSSSQLHTKLKEVIVQSGLAKNVFGNHPVSMPTAVSRGPPPAFASDPLIYASGNGGEGEDGSKISEIQPVGYLESSLIVSVPNPMEIDGSTSSVNFKSTSSPPGTTTRKGGSLPDKQSTPNYADDEDGNQKKYSRRGSFRHKFLRALIPFWSSSLPTLPVTATSKKETRTDEAPEGRPRHHRPSRMDPRKILLFIAIMACMATMGILYDRLAQRGFGEDER